MAPIIIQFCTAALIGAAAYAGMKPAAATADDLTGTWFTEDGRARVRTEHCGSGNKHLCGCVRWVVSRSVRTASRRSTGLILTRRRRLARFLAIR